MRCALLKYVAGSKCVAKPAKLQSLMQLNLTLTFLELDDNGHQRFVRLQEAVDRLKGKSASAGTGASTTEGIVAEVKKLTPGPGDVLVVRLPAGHVEMMDRTAMRLANLELPCKFVIAPKEMSLELLNEDQMAAWGWVRATAMAEAVLQAKRSVSQPVNESFEHLARSVTACCRHVEGEAACTSCVHKALLETYLDVNEVDEPSHVVEDK